MKFEPNRCFMKGECIEEMFYTNVGDGVTVGEGDILSGNIVFGDEVLVLHKNGDIYVHGRLIENDKEVVQAMRDFLHIR
jgi:hypothetical protein